MKLVYEISTGNVLGFIPDSLLPMEVMEGQALIDVPSTIPIPQAIVKVIVQDGSEIEFIIDQTLIDNQWRPIKELRAQKLRDSDWTCSVTDYTPPNKADWITYRQALRDLTQQPNPFQIVWPISPSEPLPKGSSSDPSSPSGDSSVNPVTEPVSDSSVNPVTEPVSNPVTEPIADPQL